MNLFEQKVSYINFQKDSFCLFLLSVFILFASFPIFYWGIPNGVDLLFHHQLALTYFESISSGNFLPSWSLLTNQGFGDTAVRYYPPLAHYLLALTQLITRDWFTTFQINTLFWFWVGSLGVYLFSREWLSPQNSLWVGILYAIVPYHLNQYYQFFLYSEFAASAILPFCLLYLTKVCRNQEIKDSIKLAIAYSLIILCHIPTTIIATICLSLYAILIIDWKHFPKVTFRLVLSGVLSLLSTSFYWIKLISESSFTNQSNPKQFTGFYYYKIHLFPYFISQPESYFVKQFWLRDIVSVLTFIFVLPMIGFFILRLNKNNFSKYKSQIALTVTVTFAYFMSCYPSDFIWSGISFLQRLQFPFRWLTVVSFLSVLVFVIALSQIKIKRLGAYLITGLLFVVLLFDITQIVLLSELLPPARLEKNLQHPEQDEIVQATRTIWAKEEAFQNKEKIEANSRTAKIINWESEQREFIVEAGNPTNIRIATFYYPYWEAAVNGVKTKVELNPDGTMSVSLPPEASKVSLIFNEPFSIKIAQVISFLILIILALATLIFALVDYRRPTAETIK